MTRLRFRFRGLVLVLLLLLVFVPLVGVHPAHADGCTFGDLVCDLQQAGQQLIDQYVNPLKDWAQLQGGLLLYTPVYNAIHGAATMLWSVQSHLIIVGVGIALLTQWVGQNIFQPLLTSTNTALAGVLDTAFVIILFVIAITYMLAAFVRIRVASLKNVLLWYVAALIFFQVGPSLYSWLENFREDVGSLFYAATLQCVTQSCINNPPPSPFVHLASVDPTKDSAVNGMTAVCDNFVSELSTPYNFQGDTFNGLDVALAFLKADGADVLSDGEACQGAGDLTDLPRTWYKPNGYFDATIDPNTWDISNQPGWNPQQALTRMQDSVNQALGGVSRLGTAAPLVLLGIIEQLIGLCLTIAEGLTFISLACALLFAFFQESIAIAMVKQLFGLLLQTVIIALMQALVVGLFISGANTGSPLLTVILGVAGVLIGGILLWSGIKAIWNSFNGLFTAFSSATGGVFVTPGAALGAAASTSVGLATASVGLMSGMAGGTAALMDGSTLAQSAGITLGNFPTVSRAAYQLARLPGLQDTPLAEAAEQFSEGALARQVGGKTFGGFLAPVLLSDRGDPDGKSMLVPEVGDVLEGATKPFIPSLFGKKKRKNGPDDEDSTPDEDTPVSRNRGGFVPTGRRSGDDDGGDDGQPDPAPRGKGGFIPVGRPAEEGDLPPDPTSPAAGANGAALMMTLQQNEAEAESENADDELRTVDSLRDAVHSGGAGDNGMLSTAASRFEAAAERIGVAASRLDVRGVSNIAGVMGQTVDALRGGSPDNLTVGRAMASTVGFTATDDTPPVRQNLAKFGGFVDQALNLGLNGDQAAAVVQGVKTDPKGEGTRLMLQNLRENVQSSQGMSFADAEYEVGELSRRAAMLPNVIRLTGTPASTPPVTPTVIQDNAAPDVTQIAQPTQAQPRKVYSQGENA